MLYIYNVYVYVLAEVDDLGACNENHLDLLRIVKKKSRKGFEIRKYNNIDKKSMRSRNQLSQ